MLQGLLLTIVGVALGIVLGSVIMAIMMTNRKVIQWYIKSANKITAQLFKDYEDEAL